MPTPSDREFLAMLVKELIERMTTTQERLTEIAADHEKRISAIEIVQQGEKEADEQRGLVMERRWAVWFALSSIVYTIVILLQAFHILP